MVIHSNGTVYSSNKQTSLNNKMLTLADVAVTEWSP